MPIDTDKSHGAIVRELLDEYKSNGKIGTTKPKNIEHAVRIANAIAYKAKEEAVILKMTRINEEYADNLRKDASLNLREYVDKISYANEREISAMVNDFAKNYTRLEQKRLKSIGSNKVYQFRMKAEKTNIILYNLDDGDYKIPVGFKAKLPYVTRSTAEKALVKSNHFSMRIDNSELFVEITSTFLAEIQLNFKDLSA